MRLYVSCCLTAALALSCLAGAQDSVLPGKKIAPPPKIDGVIDPAEWAGAASASGFSDTQFGAAEPEQSTFWIAYDEKYVYFAARLELKNPKDIRATEYRSNVAFPGDDSVTLSLDPFGRSGGYNQFQINPKGATGLQIAGGRAAKREWLGEFAAAGRITATGWEAEARIPWGVMRLPSPGVYEPSFNVFRYDPRLNRNYVWRYSPVSTDNYGRWAGVQVPRSGNRRTLKLLPYFYGGYDKETKYIANSGLDMKTSLTDQVDLVGSINPDFRNVERNILSLDFSHFERLAGETRPFFLEGQNLYQTSLDAPLFASQRISGFDAGVKAFGQLNTKMNIAVLDTVDIDHQNASVANFKYRPDPDTTFVGSYVSLDRPGLTNHGTFVSAFRNQGAFFAFAQHEATQDTVNGYGHRINAGGGYNKGGWNFDTEYLEITPEFLPRIGFAPERDLRGFFVRQGLDRPFTHGTFREAGYDLYVGNYNTMEGAQYRRERQANVFGTLKNGLSGFFNADYQRFFGSDDLVYSTGLSYPQGNPYNNVALNYTFGHITGIRYQNLALEGAYRPLHNFQLTFSIQGVQYTDKATQSIVGINYDLTKDVSLSGRLVRRNSDTNAYLALRKAGYAGLEYYLILGDPNAERFRKSLILKLIVPFQVRLGK
jgi:hypothetical protein